MPFFPRDGAFQKQTEATTCRKKPTARTRECGRTRRTFLLHEIRSHVSLDNEFRNAGRIGSVPAVPAAGCNSLLSVVYKSIKFPIAAGLYNQVLRINVHVVDASSAFKTFIFGCFVVRKLYTDIQRDVNKMTNINTELGNYELLMFRNYRWCSWIKYPDFRRWYFGEFYVEKSIWNIM